MRAILISSIFAVISCSSKTTSESIINKEVALEAPSASSGVVPSIAFSVKSHPKTNDGSDFMMWDAGNEPDANNIITPKCDGYEDEMESDECYCE